jgi:hypothetical protein
MSIRRDENDGDIQPHPSFCATTAIFWKKIDGDWSPGHTWKNNSDQIVTDTGGNLLEKLKGHKWYPMLRTNDINLHPLFFGIYSDIIYHHGAGFRSPVSRVDLKNEFDPVSYMQTRQYEVNLRTHTDIFNKIQQDSHFYKIFKKRSSLYCKVIDWS